MVRASLCSSQKRFGSRLVKASERAKENLRNMMESDYSHRWIYRETLIVRDLPALIAENESLYLVIDELRAEAATLRVNVSY